MSLTLFPDDPKLLYLGWTDEDALRPFEPELMVEGPAPSKASWSPEFLRQAQAKLRNLVTAGLKNLPPAQQGDQAVAMSSRQPEDTPFLSLTQNPLFALHRAIHTQKATVKSYITVIDGRKIRANFISVTALREAFEKNGLGEVEYWERNYLDEWLHWGALPKSPSASPLLGTVACTDILNLCQEDSNVKFLLDVSTIQQETWAEHAMIIFMEQNRPPDEVVGSAIGTLARKFGLTPSNMGEQGELLMRFVSQCTWVWGIGDAVSEEAKEAARAALAIAFTDNSDDIAKVQEVVTGVHTF